MNLISTLLVVSLYLIKSNFLFTFFQQIWLNELVSYSVLLGVPLFLSLLSLKCNRILQKDSLTKTVKKVSSANKEYLPVYLGYFFVSLSIPGSSGHLECDVLILFVFIIWVFTSATTTYYYNPLLLLFGYKFYNVVSHNGIELFIITRRTIKKNEQDIRFLHLRKITEYVYIEQNS